VVKLLRSANVTVIEADLTYSDFVGADEMFSSGNSWEVSPITRIDDRLIPPGPFYQKARELYWAFAHDLK
jgi:branched-chain amino acid aminotransferase